MKFDRIGPLAGKVASAPADRLKARITEVARGCWPRMQRLARDGEGPKEANCQFIDAKTFRLGLGHSLRREQVVILSWASRFHA